MTFQEHGLLQLGGKIKNGVWTVRLRSKDGRVRSGKGARFEDAVAQALAMS